MQFAYRRDIMGLIWWYQQNKVSPAKEGRKRYNMAYLIKVEDEFGKIIETTYAYDEEERDSLLDEIEEDYPDCEVSWEEVQL